MSFKKITLVEKFDIAIKNACAPEDIGYIFKDKKEPYAVYQQNKDWNAFVSEMQQLYPDAYKQYGLGGGSELAEKWGKPPKMASYASSSRFIYLLARDCKTFEFEKKLPTTAGGTANLDGYLNTEDSYIFVEAKCHEPYSHSRSVKVGKKYKDLYIYLNNNFADLNISMGKAKKDSDMLVEFSYNNQIIGSFDLKQMISHLCGIATACIKGKYTDKPVEFVYLLYNPKMVTDDVEILNVYNSTCEQFKSIDFKALFGFIIDALIAEYDLKPICDNLDYIKSNFSFYLSDQEDFKRLIF